jgi:hypothetical protein
MPRSPNERFYQAARNAQDETEYEIGDSVFDDQDDQPSRRDEVEENHELVEMMSRSESIDGGELSEEEELAAHMGAAPEGYMGDRPLQYQHERELAARDQYWKQQVDGRDTYINTLKAQYDPEIQAQRTNQRFEWWDKVAGGVPFDDQRADQFVGQVTQLQNENSNLKMQIAEAKLQRASEEYGPEYTRAYDALRAASNTAAGQAALGQVLQAVQNGGDPSEVVLEWGRTMQQPSRNEMPFAQSRDNRFSTAYGMAPDRRPMTQNELEQTENSSGGDETSIFNSIWRDY